MDFIYVYKEPLLLKNLQDSVYLGRGDCAQRMFNVYRAEVI